MMLGFTCKNYKSYRAETIFSMLASSRKEYELFNTFETKHGTLLKSALVFGANASGKSNLVKALAYMKEMVEFSVIVPKFAKANEPFRFFVESQNESTLFEIAFIVDDVLYTYGFEIYKTDIIKEWLNKKVEKTVPLFKRDGAEWKNISLFSEMRQAEEIKHFTRPDSLFISTASMFNIESAQLVSQWFSKLVIINADQDNIHYTLDYIAENPESKQKVLALLRKADVGIEDIEFEFKDGEDSDVLDKEVLPSITVTITKKNRKVKIDTMHNVYNEHKSIVNLVKLPFLEYQSQGTVKLFQLLGPIFMSLEKGSLLIIDEIDSKLHPAIVRYIQSLYNSIDYNNNNAQLLCNTHDALLLEENIRRDQVWFVDKNAYGESSLYSLTDFNNVRKNDPTLKKYLLGVYGAIPFSKGSES